MEDFFATNFLQSIDLVEDVLFNCENVDVANLHIDCIVSLRKP
jgi:hypothetical protein